MTSRTEGDKIVMARNFSLRNIPIWNNVFGVKIDFSCGKCGYSQSTRVSIQDYPVVECGHCRTLNRINIVVTTYGCD